MTQRGYIYLIQADGLARIKIGFSANPKPERLISTVVHLYASI
jgi:hypothetical protein